MFANSVSRRIADLKSHLKEENPEMLGLVETYEGMDAILHKLRLIPHTETLTARIAWWPVISYVGLFSSGKSTAVNDFVGRKIQRVGKQAVDDKFTVICHGPQYEDLPGTALAVDSRFPFYGMADEIEKVAPGEGKLTDRYLALKVVPSDDLRGLVVIDSPGFDSDEYRNATLRLVDHMLNLSDLVLVYFDANKPEPGAMRDTLSILVNKIKSRSDTDKFLFVLNQIDMAAKDGNLEEVVSAWQRALASAGLTTSKFYTLFSKNSAIAFENMSDSIRITDIAERDHAEIRQRIKKLPSKRVYRIASAIESVAKEINDEAVPMLLESFSRWKKSTMLITYSVFGGILGSIAGLTAILIDPTMPLLLFVEMPIETSVSLLFMFTLIHWKAGQFMAKKIGAKLPEKLGDFDLTIRSAFLGSAKFPAIFRFGPKGWSSNLRAKIDNLREGLGTKIRAINDRFLNVSPAE